MNVGLLEEQLQRIRQLYCAARDKGMYNKGGAGCEVGAARDKGMYDKGGAGCEVGAGWLVGCTSHVFWGVGCAGGSC